MTNGNRLIETDFLVVGGGVAGLQAAISASASGQVLVANKGSGCSELAQGGVAVALDGHDEPRLHLEDTLHAGKGVCDPETAGVMVREGPDRVAELIRWGARFDRTDSGEFELGREGAHSRRRILKAGGDATGKEIVRALTAEAESRGRISRLDDHFVSELLIHRGRCVGALLLPGPSVADRRPLVVAARAVLLAAGGAGQVYRRTTNPDSATGDGMAMAARAGAGLRHMEFVQFHPTMLADPYPPFLLSEAMRGEGGVLKNRKGRAFMADYHPLADLAPRDDVSRAIWREMTRDGSDHVGLDMTELPVNKLEQRFPTIVRTCVELGLDVRKAPIPVAPAAHFFMGGIRVDGWGRSRVPGLYAMGEAACSGVHGANRLASNSLLEALVFGARSGSAAVLDSAAWHADLEAAARTVARIREKGAPVDTAPLRQALQDLMWTHVGVVRDGHGLKTTLDWVRARMNEAPYRPYEQDQMEWRNLLMVARAIAGAALRRTRGVGAHYRLDGTHKGTAAMAG